MDRWTSGAHYDQWMGRWSRVLAQEFLNWLDLPAGLRWLDVCCGSGTITEAVVERNMPASIVGVDASPDQISFARQYRAHPNIIFETADAMALPFQDSSFDVAVCGLGLNFLPSPARALEEFRRVTRPGGHHRGLCLGLRRGSRVLARVLGRSHCHRSRSGYPRPGTVSPCAPNKACAASSNKRSWKTQPCMRSTL